MAKAQNMWGPPAASQRSRLDSLDSQVASTITVWLMIVAWGTPQLRRQTPSRFRSQRGQAGPKRKTYWKIAIYPSLRFENMRCGGVDKVWYFISPTMDIYRGWRYGNIRLARIQESCFDVCSIKNPREQQKFRVAAKVPWFEVVDGRIFPRAGGPFSLCHQMNIEDVLDSN